MTPFFQKILHEQGISGLFEFSKRQAILGYVWDELQSEELKGETPEDRKILRRWYTLVCKIEEKNKLINEQIEVVEKKFQKDGFNTRILKGASLAPLYDNPLRRSTGDIDIWLRYPEENSLSKNRERIVQYVRKTMPSSKICYHHMEFPKISDTDIEVHFTPTWRANPHYNKQLQQFFKSSFSSTTQNSKLKTQNSETPLYSSSFDQVFVLVHIFRHLFQEGISLKQVLDYYYILTNSQLSTLNSQLKNLGLSKFFSALLWVEKEVFGLDEKYISVPLNEKEGQFLLKEILLRGGVNNDDSNCTEQLKMSDFTSDNHAHNFLSRIKRMNTMIYHYPDEALWEIPWRIWHFLWRKVKGF